MRRTRKLLMLVGIFGIWMLSTVYVKANNEMDIEKNSNGVDKMFRYNNIQDVSVRLEKSGSILKAKVTVTPYRVMDIKITMYLQNYSSATWKNIKNWTTTKQSATYCSLIKSATVSGGKYRLKAIINCNGEIITKYSNSITV